MHPTRIASFLLLAGTLVAQTASRPASAPASRPESRPDTSPVVMPGSRIVWDVPYVAQGGPQQSLDVYGPPLAKAAPVVLYVHGGEWAKGDKSEVSSKPRFFNQAGMVFVSVNYRLSGTARHPAQVDDVAAAVRWTRDHIAEYGGDPRQLVLMGHSAGCHLVSMVGLDPRPLQKVGLAPADLKGVVSWSGGVFDLVAKMEEGGTYANYIRVNFGESDAAAWADASPVNHVRDGKDKPWFLYASADGDRPAAVEMSRKLVASIRSAGGEARFVTLADRTHRTANHLVGAQGDTTGETLLQFVREVAAR